MERFQIGAIVLMVVLVAGMIAGTIVFAIQSNTERRNDCVENDGSWVTGSQCLRFVQPTEG